MGVWVCTRSLAIGDVGDEGHEAGTAEELGDKDGGVGLGLGGVYPLQALSKHAVVAATLSKNPAAITTHLRHIHFTERERERERERVVKLEERRGFEEGI
jgi:hypothetical protein